ncbi:MAG: hypothetical protein ACM3ML_21580, partial [Micromonosporaceae bacterium]
MDLNPRQQKFAFAVIVVMLAGLGVYLVLPRATAGQHVPASTPTARAPASVPASTPPTQPVATPSQSAAVNIFQWLPFTQNDLVRAASVATQAASYYDTYRYDE